MINKHSISLKVWIKIFTSIYAAKAFTEVNNLTYVRTVRHAIGYFLISVDFCCYFLLLSIFFPLFLSSSAYTANELSTKGAVSTFTSGFFLLV